MANNTISQVEINGTTYDLLDANTLSALDSLKTRVTTLESSVDWDPWVSTSQNNMSIADGGGSLVASNFDIRANKARTAITIRGSILISSPSATSSHITVRILSNPYPDILISQQRLVGLWMRTLSMSAWDGVLFWTHSNDMLLTNQYNTYNINTVNSAGSGLLRYWIPEVIYVI